MMLIKMQEGTVLILKEVLLLKTLVISTARKPHEVNKIIKEFLEQYCNV